MKKFKGGDSIGFCVFASSCHVCILFILFRRGKRILSRNQMSNNKDFRCKTYYTALSLSDTSMQQSQCIVHVEIIRGVIRKILVSNVSSVSWKMSNWILEG